MINIRRAVIGAGTALALGAGGLLPGVSQAQAASSAPPATVNDLSVRVRPVDDHSAGHSYVRLVYRNTSGHRVSIKGFAGVSFVAYGNGTQVGEPARWLTNRRADRVVLRPGSSTDEIVSIADPGVFGPTKHHTVTADGFRVYLPGETRAIFTRYRTSATTRKVIQLSADPIGARI